MRLGTLVLSVLLILLGLVLLAETVLVGGSVGYLLGALLVGAGAGRIYLGRSSRMLRDER